MSNEIIIDINKNYIKVAFLENGELVEFHLEKDIPDRLTGNIYKGVVKSVLPGMQAAFVDIGCDKNAFLYAADAILGEKILLEENEFPAENFSGTHISGTHQSKMHLSGVHPADSHQSKTHASGTHPDHSHQTKIHISGTHLADSHQSKMHVSGAHPADSHQAKTHASGTHPDHSHQTKIHISGTHPADSHQAKTHASGTHPADSHQAKTHASGTHPDHSHQTKIHISGTHPADSHQAKTHASGTHPADSHQAKINVSGVSGNHIPDICEILKPGQEVTVQVIKEAMGGKGPRISTNLTIPRKYLVLLPFSEYSGVSKRIEGNEEKQRLRSLADKLRPEGMGLIVRTMGEGISFEELEEDKVNLLKQWEMIRKKALLTGAPKCIYKEPDIVLRTIRDSLNPSIDRLVINEWQQYQKILELLNESSPGLKHKIEFYNKDYDILDFYNINSQLDRALSRKVWLKSGGYLVVDRTEALTVIDVNTGKFIGNSNLEDTVHKTNLEAVEEISRQLRLRDIGGIIIIDFIDMAVPEHRQTVLDALKVALKKDKTRSSVVGMTGLGMIEMTRKKVNQELSDLMSRICPHCEGSGKTRFL